MKLTISTYIPTYNALFYQCTLEQTIRQSALFSDEIIVANSENSNDGTQNLLDKLEDEIDILKVYKFKQDYSRKWNTITDKKSFALSKCTSDYCILQDDDECISEEYANHIRSLPSTYPYSIAFRFNTTHFYRSYFHYQPSNDNWYGKKIYMIRNLPEIRHGAVKNDLDNHVVLYNDEYIPLDNLPNITDTPINVFHYGWCRNDAILLMKKYQQDAIWHGKEYWKDKEFPYKFDNPKDLPEFKGTHPKYMIPIINQEIQFNSRHTNEFTK